MYLTAGAHGVVVGLVGLIVREVEVEAEERCGEKMRREDAEKRCGEKMRRKDAEASSSIDHFTCKSCTTSPDLNDIVEWTFRIPASASFGAFSES
jgi:hypothetical protein